jgi:L-fuculose-phosphate aldolase
MVDADPAAVEELKGRLIDGLKVITYEGVLSGSGHLSVRIPGTDTFLINPRFPGALAQPEDICTVDASGKRIAGAGPIPSETYIHSAIYAARPDVNSVLHCHPRYSILMGLLDTGLVPFNREARMYAEGIAVYTDSRGVNTPERGAELAQALGDRQAAFLRGHGVVVTGPTIEGTCIAAIGLERACADQLLLMTVSTPKPMDDAWRPKVRARLENPYRAWPFLLHKHGIRSAEEIRANVRPPAEGVHLG